MFPPLESVKITQKKKRSWFYIFLLFYYVCILNLLTLYFKQNCLFDANPYIIPLNPIIIFSLINPSLASLVPPVLYNLPNCSSKPSPLQWTLMLSLSVENCRYTVYRNGLPTAYRQKRRIKGWRVHFFEGFFLGNKERGSTFHTFGVLWKNTLFSRQKDSLSKLYP